MEIDPQGNNFTVYVARFPNKCHEHTMVFEYDNERVNNVSKCVQNHQSDFSMIQ